MNRSKRPDYNIKRSRQVLYLMVCKETHLRPDLSMSPIAIKMQGSMSKHVTPLARIDADCPPIPKLARTSPAPACIKICGVK